MYSILDNYVKSNCKLDSIQYILTLKLLCNHPNKENETKLIQLKLQQKMYYKDSILAQICYCVSD